VVVVVVVRVSVVVVVSVAVAVVEVVVHPPASAFSVWTEFAVPTGQRCGCPRGVPLVTRMFASSEQANMRTCVGSNGILECKSVGKKEPHRP
jgi:hypothetical protein